MLLDNRQQQAAEQQSSHTFNTLTPSGSGSDISGDATIPNVYSGKYADKDTYSHFQDGGGLNLPENAENATRLAHGAKDRYGSESINDRAASYDLVYGAEHEGACRRRSQRCCALAAALAGGC